MSLSSQETQRRRQVNNLLHTLRGEQFRHQQNLRRSRADFNTTRAYNLPTLPPGLLSELNQHNSSPITQPKAPEKASTSSGSWSGPSPPKSWIKRDALTDPQSTPVWRREAFAIVAQHINGFLSPEKVPPLSLMCLRAIVSRSSNDEELKDLMLYVPEHLQRDLIRYHAIHSPLPQWKLNVLLALRPGGHVDGEILVVGPKANLTEDHFLVNNSEGTANSQELDWESEEHSNEPLRHLFLVSTRLSTAMLLTLPPTLTHIALIHLPSPIPLARLTKLCPLLVLLDLSFNSWLCNQLDAEDILDKVDWSRWSHLQVLGLRECYVPADLLQNVNKHRWDDVSLIR
ncbi:hypothetical protein CVT24_008948 [Panaeolus cyanescens]|uniref:Uncharacterized protein n=1 Tax=Panaeolus cyanescens TaxID=181874 RepID=A0A409WCL3_9AGAR|nr:hypothetical protein CVT24_008948 [Panaeolus cyanescens]